MEFIDLKSQYALLRDAINSRMQAVLDHGMYIMGPEIAEFERHLADFSGVRHALTCANGTDALVLTLMAKGIKPGDAVFVPAFTFVATAEAVVLVGATPVFVDVSADTYNISPDSLQAAIEAVIKEGCLKPACVMPVDLFGQPADYDRIGEIARQHGMFLLADAAQSFGATWHGSRVGGFGDATATSFFPAKPLGCYGDGGAIFTNDDALAEIMKSVRVHGQGVDRYDNVRIGINGRLDTLQAAVLIEKLRVFPEEIGARQAVAERYNEAFGDVAVTPLVDGRATSVWAQYTLQVDHRDAVVAELKAVGIPTAIYYPRPLHTQAPYASFPQSPTGMSQCEWLAGRVFSLPMHPYLDEGTQQQVIDKVCKAIKDCQ
ncbi:MAG: DegT/DnrJ/EryC1/StrS family aminotransferase [Pseudomonadota bacterium]|nr:DegT/DnrJ/EryC1/StrS family aminotransferase [Pseudomonadota bacterium]